MTNAVVVTTNVISIAKQIGEYTSIAQNIVLALCGLATVVIAYLGLTTWRKELKGKSEYAKAKEVLKAVYKVQRGFMHVRGPAIYSYEYPEEMRDDFGSPKAGKDYEATAHVYDTRWKVLSESFRELEEQNLDAQVEWGPEFKDAMVPLRKCNVELRIAIQDFLEGKKNPYERRSRSPEEKAAERSILYYVGENSKHDTFTPEINAAIEQLEKKLRPHIQR